MTDPEATALGYIERADPLAQSVVQQITGGIISGTLRPGDKLVEARLAEQLGVSRVPIREAFRRLEQMGLVERVPYRGAFVSTLTPRDIEELHSVRGQLEGLAARLLAERHDPQVTRALETLLDAMRAAAARDDQAAMIGLDADFHDALIRLSDHKLLADVWVAVSVRLRRFLLLKRQRLYPTLDQAAPLHAPIVDAIVAGDPDRAEAAARAHIRDAGAAWMAWSAAQGASPQAASSDTEVAA